GERARRLCRSTHIARHVAPSPACGGGPGWGRAGAAAARCLQPLRANSPGVGTSLMGLQFGGEAPENPGKRRFFSQLRGERWTADLAALWFWRQQYGAGRGRSGLYVLAGWLEGLSRMGLASGGSGRPVLGGTGTGVRRG